MLVSVGRERTEVAVLEERDLVEHYVTRKANESYVGNIYLGRVQNVLPGMEAAFVDIGKGRNGVLYAGEVNYDDEDVESKAPRIEQALKPGQTVVVQVTKDPMGTKGARLTQQLSLAGRFCVLAIEDGTVGISRKLTDSERDRLRETLREIKPEGYGLIVRTAAAGATDEQLQADVKRLLERWGTVQQRLTDAKPLTEVYREPELAMRVIRDVFGPEYRELICDDRQLIAQIQEYLYDVSPDLAQTVTHYEGEEPLFDAYEITNQVRRAPAKEGWLWSGGDRALEEAAGGGGDGAVPATPGAGESAPGVSDRARGGTSDGMDDMLSHMVIFGGAGDLTARLLLPALAHLRGRDALPVAPAPRLDTTSASAGPKWSNRRSSAARAVRLEPNGVWRLRSLRVRVSHMISWPRQYVARPSRKW